VSAVKIISYTPFYSLFVFFLILSAVASSRELSNMVERKGFGRAGCRVIVLVKDEPTQDEKDSYDTKYYCFLDEIHLKSSMPSLPAHTRP
jgi:hypothetical protein